MKNKNNSLSRERKEQDTEHYRPMSDRKLHRFSGIKTFFHRPYDSNIIKKFDVAFWRVSMTVETLIFLVYESI